MNEQTPDDAERAGAFVEDALSERDAAASGDDLAEVDGALGPTFLDDEGPVADLPTFVDTANVRSLYGWKPGESLDEAIARKAREG